MRIITLLLIMEDLACLLALQTDGQIDVQKISIKFSNFYKMHHYSDARPTYDRHPHLLPAGRVVSKPVDRIFS